MLLLLHQQPCLWLTLRRHGSVQSRRGGTSAEARRGTQNHRVPPLPAKPDGELSNFGV